MTKILILQGGNNEEHKVSLNTSKEVKNSLIKLKIKFKVLTVNPTTFANDILKYLCFNKANLFVFFTISIIISKPIIIGYTNVSL